MDVATGADTAIVSAARAGDRAALDALLTEYLPLVYNIVGRALNDQDDVDDVVQDTMVRVVDHLAELRDPGAFRAWLVAIAVRQVRDRRRLRDGGAVSPLSEAADEARELADPGADFVDLTILRLELSDQRRETALATRWLDGQDRELLALWWLECAGQLSRSELSEALGMSPGHAAVRVQRMKAQLDVARVVVRALDAQPPCADFAVVAAAWDGRPSSVWRKRFARHTRECIGCGEQWRGLAPADGLLAGTVLVPLAPGGLTPVPHPLNATTGRRAARGGRSGAHAGRTAALHLSAKGVAAATALLVTAGAGTVYAVAGHDAPTRPVAAPTRAPQTPVRAASHSPSPSPSPSPSRTRTTPSPSSSPSPTRTVAAFVYGQTVDRTDSAPPAGRFPAALPVRPAGTVSVTGNYTAPFKGALGGDYLMLFNTQKITISGRGYFSVRWEVAWFNRSAAQLVMPTWTGLEGRLFHVASGGGYRMTDSRPDGPTRAYTWMGNPKAGYDTLPAGAQQMWEVEYYYLDGSVTLHQNEGTADYNLGITPVTRATIVDDITTRPGANEWVLRYGLVRDTGTDAAPVPQYLTRAAPTDQTTVPQRSSVRTG
ncbi:RNA polymerase sigma factor (sigma-70 family) [Streptomyces sp. 846.5]|nr:sigma-70 family RNA polymerase sigma factor [Streptomyces sp. 846.5]TDT97489.1 RNA polymerase sigma factor (sigma-70 family) [Streptomyces sp. 846.5]